MTRLPWRHGVGHSHMFLSVPLSREQVEAIGQRERWTTRFCGRPSESLLAPGQKPFFHLIEVWVEEHFLIEVVPQNYVAEYEALFQLEVLDRMAAQGRDNWPAGLAPKARSLVTGIRGGG